MAFLNQLTVDFESNFKPRTSSPRLISGHDLTAEFGLEPSPLYKQILDRVEQERLSGGNMTRLEAFNLVREFIRNQRSSEDR